ncbi:MAG: hypothetical protein AAFP19_19275 [Bacteroidota bacterium]
MFGRLKAKARERSEKLKKVAFQLDMDFIPIDEYGFVSMLKDFRLFKYGHSKKITNMMYKRDVWNQLDVRLFDYRFVIQAGNTPVHHRQSVIFIQSKLLNLPEFLLKPETFFHWVAAKLGMEDIDFEAFPEFSNQYHLTGRDEELIRHQFNKDVLQFFTIEKDWRLEGVNYYLIFYKRRHLFSPEEIKSFYQKGMQLYQMLREQSKEEPK